MMYKREMKTNSIRLEEAKAEYKAEPSPSGTMVRTQVYLTPEEHAFVQREGSRLGKPMAALIRGWIDEKMNVPEDAWANSPLLEAPADPEFAAPEDAAMNHDHYVYGSPKKYAKKKGAWVQLPSLP